MNSYDLDTEILMLRQSRTEAITEINKKRLTYFKELRVTEEENRKALRSIDDDDLNMIGEFDYLTTSRVHSKEIDNDENVINSIGSTPSTTSHTVEATKKSPNTTTSIEKITELLQKQKDISSKEVDNEILTQTVLMEEIQELAFRLRMNTEHISKSISAQNMNLESLHMIGQGNQVELAYQRNELKERENNMRYFQVDVECIIYIY